LFLPHHESTTVLVFFGSEIAFAVKEVFIECADVVFALVPLVNPIAVFLSVGEIPLKERNRAVDFACFAGGHVVDPVPLVEEFGGGQLTIAVGFVVLDGALVESGFVLDEEGVFAVSHSVLEAALIDRAVVVDQPAEAMRQSVHPLPLVVRRIVEDIVEWQFDSFLTFGGMMWSKFPQTNL
jgi:hypothetical protein